MLGAIIGDIIGSIYEWDNIKTKEFPLFQRTCHVTDDTIMTCAIAEAILNGGEEDDFIDAMKHYGRMYPDSDYGSRFNNWLMSDTREPYNSFGNGSAMRVSPCAWSYDCADLNTALVRARELAKRSAAVTHNHPEGIKGAMAVSDVIILCRHYFGSHNSDKSSEYKKLIKDYIETEYHYDLSKSLDEIRPNYGFYENCQGTVPEAIIAFLESTDFEDAIRNAISLGGDSDTLAAITGSIAEAAYGIPEDIEITTYEYLDNSLKDLLQRWRSRYHY